MCVFDTSRVSPLRWQGSLVRLKLEEWVTYYRCQLKPFRLLLRTELQWASTVCKHLHIHLHICFLISCLHILPPSPYSLLATKPGCHYLTTAHRKPHMIGSTAPCLWNVPLNPGKECYWYKNRLAKTLLPLFELNIKLVATCTKILPGTTFFPL